MASSKGYLEFVLDQLSGLRGITHRAMMGEYIIYYQGKVIGGIYDDRFLVKNTASARQLMPDAPLEMPYEGGSPMLLVEDIDDREFLEKLFDSMVDELPAPKTKKRG
ncbi:MAG: TfoX/Sxy family protein [Oscillospiraceae bacterium]|nr:TfoX/Sxy family protein [Oscillospiraceae bacterium]